jgi:hypothetical protein
LGSLFYFLGTLTAQDEYHSFLFRVQEVSCSENDCSFLITAVTSIGIDKSSVVIGRANQQNPQHEGVLAENVIFVRNLDENNTVFRAHLSKKEQICICL